MRKANICISGDGERGSRGAGDVVRRERENGMNANASANVIQDICVVEKQQG